VVGWHALRQAGVVVVALGTVAASAGAAQASRPGDRAPASGIISTVAGGVGGPGQATAVSLADSPDELCGVGFGAGQVYAADADSVRAIDPQTGWLTTPAGTGVGALSSSGVPAIADGMELACGVATDAHGNLVIADEYYDQVQVVAAKTGIFYGQPMTAGDMYTVAGDGAGGFSGDGGPATSAELYHPHGVAVDGAGNLVIADVGNERVRVVAAVTGTFYGQPMTAGDIYTVAGDGTGGFSGDGGLATQAELNAPDGVAVDGAGNQVIADTGNNRIRMVTH
jgi:NHL repeat-containing protein